MDSPRHAVAVALCTACGANQSGPAAPVPNATPESAALPASSAPTSARRTAEPTECVDDPLVAWRAELDRGIDALLPELASCTAKLTKPGAMSVTFGFGATPGANVQVRHSNLGDCAVIACIKRGLASVRAPATRVEPFEAAVSETVLELIPAATPRRTDDGARSALKEAKECVPPAPPPPPLASGRLPPAEIQSVVLAHYDALRRCYTDGRSRDAGLAGKVDVRFVIERDGHVLKSKVSASTIVDCAVTACVRDQFMSMTFPPPRGGLTVVYPIVFEP